MVFSVYAHLPSEGREVYDSMNAVRFELHGRRYSYGDFYRGFGLSCTMSMLLSAFLSWHLGGLARSNPTAVGFMGWMFFFVQLPGILLSFLFWAAADGVSLLVALTSAAALADGRSKG